MKAMNCVKRAGLVGWLGIAATCGVGSAATTPKPEAVALTESGEKLRAQYAATLAALQAEITQAVPGVDEPKKSAFLQAREATKKAKAEANATQQPLDKIQTAKALVDHAKGKGIGGAEKDLAKAEAKLKKATTEAERETARNDLGKAQADKDAGIKALKERQEALDKATLDEPRLTQAHQAAQAALARAQDNELAAAKLILTGLETFLSSAKLDAKLVKCAVLAEATPRGLAEFAEQGKGGPEALVEKLLANTALMKEMLEAGGAKGGKYGQAMRILADIRMASPRAQQGILHRLALATSLEHAVPLGQRNAVTETTAPTVVDPVKRFQHYEKAFLDGELDPAFPTMTAWECRMIVNCEAPDHILAWGREMLRNYRPDHVFNPDYGWRYSGAVRTDVAYRHSQEYHDTDSLQSFQNIIKNGGICGRRAFFGRFIIQSFGLPAWGVAQHAHAAVGRWTPAGWVVNLGAGWNASWFDGRTGSDFLLETQARHLLQDYPKVLRAQWVGAALGEQKCDSMKEGTGGWWNTMALYEKKVIVAAAKPAQLAALGQELGEANESSENKTTAVAKAAVTDADKKVTIAPDGVITIPAAACSGAPLVKSFLGGQQLICGGGTMNFEANVPRAGNYALTARVVAVHDESHLQLTPNHAKDSIDMTIPYTCGLWQKTKPVEVTLVQGKNVLGLAKPASSFSLKDLTLTPVK